MIDDSFVSSYSCAMLNSSVSSLERYATVSIFFSFFMKPSGMGFQLQILRISLDFSSALLTTYPISFILDTTTPLCSFNLLSTICGIPWRTLRFQDCTYMNKIFQEWSFSRREGSSLLADWKQGHISETRPEMPFKTEK